MRRLETLLLPEEIQLLYLLCVADWSAAALAKEWKIHRANVVRRKKRILSILANDPILQQAAFGACRQHRLSLARGATIGA
jgi:hypothetical protein